MTTRHDGRGMTESAQARRRRAEQAVFDAQAGAPEVTAGEALGLVHELRVHQIELELQNDELRRIQEELELARERYFELYDLAPVGYLTIDADGRILEANRHAVGLLGSAGAAAVALTGERLSRFVAPEGQDAFYLYHRKLFATGAAGACELHMVGPGGGGFWARLEAIAVSAGPDGASVCRTALTDISERRRAEEVQREREAMFRALFEHSPIGKAKSLPDGTLVMVNQRLTDMLGYSTEDLGTLAVATHPDDVAVSRACARGLLAGDRDTCALEHRLVHRDGRVIDASINTTLLRDGDGHPLYFITAIEDVSARRRADVERRELRDRLATAERMASMGLLAAGLAHEINNPLAIVMTNLALILRDVERDAAKFDELRPSLLGALEGAERVKHIVRDVRIFARGDEAKLGPVDVRPVLESTLRLAVHLLRGRARVVTHFGTTPPVLATESRLGQIFLNLIVNAAEAIPEGRADANEIRVETSIDASGRVVVVIVDSGAGVAEGDLGRLFDPFYTTKPIGQGLGLGLSICHRLVADLGGVIAVESVLGQGTKFRVALPTPPIA